MTAGSLPVRLGLVGCGRLAEIGYVPAVELARGIEIVGVVDPDLSRRDAIARQRGGDVAAVADLATLLASDTVDGVVLASPASAHVADAERAVGAGLPVLVEKPPAPDAAGARRLTELGTLVRVGFNRRYDAGARSVRATLGSRNAVRGDRVELDLAIRYRRASWKPHTVHDDVLADLGPHLLDWARWLTGGDVVEVAAHELGTDRAVLDLTLTAGRARVTAAADRFHAEHLVARDGAGTEIARHEVGGLVAAITDRFTKRGRPHPLVASLAAQLVDFAEVVRGGDAPDLGTAADGLAVMAAIDAARASAVSAGRATPIDHLEQPSC
ncbi:MAG: Gfo/Idh/MocA family oxidoreductase [Acidimicrobiales bacterium]|nr:Gfo/Idh/MocA family oxidoreductase [Acidimicrobiales bacterium]